MNEDDLFFYRGKVIGEVSNNRYRKTVNPKKHYCRKFEGYGIQAEVFEELGELGVKKIQLRIANTNEYLISNYSAWKKLGVVATLHRAYGEQVFLAEKHMERKVLGA